MADKKKKRKKTKRRYAALGCTQYHDNCTDNLHAALRQLDLRANDCPAPLNLWMNILMDLL